MGVKISDEHFILHIISNLPEEYDNVIERIEDDIEQIEIEELCQKLNVKYEKNILRQGSHKQSYKRADGEETALMIASGEEK